ncbi:MAG TPA: CHAT domain-containing protein [Gemmatimonadaceae bacterium]
MISAVRYVALALVCTVACRGTEPTVQRGDAGARLPGEKSLLPTDPPTLARMLNVPVDSLRGAAEERYQRQSYDSAAAIFQTELIRATRAGDRKAEARAHMWLGMAAWRLSDYKRARAEGERAVSMKRALGMDGELSRSFNALGLVAWNEGRQRNALLLFDSALAAARRNHDSTGFARASANVPLVKVELGDFDGARLALDVALPAARAIGDERLEGNDLANLGMLDIRVGDAAAALPLLVDARRHYRTIKYETGEANALGQLATAWGQLGDLQRAIGAADSGLSIARGEGLTQEVAADLEVIADLHAEAGDNQLALRRLALADSLDTQLGLATERGTNMRRMATILMAVGDTAGSIARARQALAMHEKTEAKEEVVYDRLQLAQSLSANRSFALAHAELDSALLEAHKLDDRALSRDAASAAARLALDARDPRRVLEILGTADGAAASDWATSDLRAQALLALGRVDDARREAKQSIAALERERASLGFGPLRSGYLGDRAAPYAHLVAVELARHDTASAFQAVASVPGRSLTERLGAIAHPAPSIAAIAEGERLLVRVASLENELSDLGTDANVGERRASLQRALENSETEYTDHLSRTAAATGILTVRPPRLADIQSRLSGAEALIVFLSGPDHLDSFALSRNRIAYRATPLGSEEMRTRVRVVRELLNRPSNDAARNALADLHRILLDPWKDTGVLHGVDHLVIVPHGALAALPFAALWNRSTGRFVIEDYAITTLPSVAALAKCCDSTRVDLSRTLILAPLASELPGTRREANAIAHAVPGAEVKLNAASTEQAALAGLAAGRPLHVASHGSHNAQNPLFSSMVVGAARHDSPGSDGLLEVHEILGISTLSPLVYLSGCETALSRAADNAFASSSDENSLAESFLIAGARTVVATLWRVDDASAANIAEAFYTRLQAGGLPEDALAYAQRRALKGAHNFTWASYTIASTRSRDAAASR